MVADSPLAQVHIDQLETSMEAAAFKLFPAKGHFVNLNQLVGGTRVDGQAWQALFFKACGKSRSCPSQRAYREEGGQWGVVSVPKP